ncbi:MAG: shikimate dehydrogenase [Desulfobacterota bacterium]|nr:shikimate dehydrogenase [Thermodesulfobacteriota bacterium]
MGELVSRHEFERQIMIDQQTQLYGVIGHPLGHTLSPVLHNAAFRALALNAVYLAFETLNLPEALAGMKALNLRGLSVTIPHKTAVIPLLDGVDELAGKIGAVNTITNRGGRLIGTNTDALGALKALQETTELAGKSGLIIGAGGTARALGFMLREQGVRLTLTNRSPDRGKALADLLDCPFLPLNEINQVKADLLIQTTPVGLSPQADQCPVGPENLEKGLVVMDVIYNPPETRLIRLARERGCAVVSGLTMFLHQGAEQFRHWTGLEPPFPEMAAALERALGEGT